MKLPIILLFLCTTIHNVSLAQCSSGETYVPDDNFEQALMDLGYDSGPLDDCVPTANINTLTNLDLSNKDINSLAGIEDFTALTSLNVNENNLTFLNTSTLTNLQTLTCNFNVIPNFDISQNTQLEIFDCSQTTVSTLDLSQNPLLTDLRCSCTNLSTLDFSQNISLTYLDCSINGLNSIDVTMLTDLLHLNCFATPLTSIDLSNNLMLENLFIDNTSIASLDLSQNSQLIELYATYNPLTQFPIGIENIQTLSQVFLSDCNLTGCWPTDLGNLCAQLNVNSYDFSNNNYDGVTDFISNQGWIDFCANATGSCGQATEVYITNNSDFDIYEDAGSGSPTANICVGLENPDPSIPTTVDLQVGYYDGTFYGSPEAIEGSDIQNFGIQTVTFPANDNTEQCFVVTVIDDNDIEGPEGFVMELTNPSGGNAATLGSQESGNIKFLFVYDDDYNCGGASDLPMVSEQINCINGDTYFEVVYQSGGTAGMSFSYDIDAIYMGYLNVPDPLPQVGDIILSVQLADDPYGMSGYSFFMNLYNCDDYTQYYTSPWYSTFDCFGNLEICDNAIDDDGDGQVDCMDGDCDSDPACSSTCTETYVPDDNFEQALIDLGYDSGPLDDCVPTSNINTILDLNVIGKGINDLTGIEDFVDLVNLNVSDNNLASLDISSLPNLVTLNYRQNILTSLDLSQNIQLTHLYSRQNQLTSLDVSQNGQLTYLDCGQNQLTSLDVSQNTQLSYLQTSDNQLSTIDLSQNTLLIDLYADNNQITSIDISNNTNLVTVAFNGNPLGSIDLSNNILLETLFLDFTSIVSLDLSQNSQLVDLYASNNPLTQFPIGIENIQTLSQLYLSDCNLSGCWPTDLGNLCSQLAPSNYNFNANNYDGVTDFISNQGWTDFCSNQTGVCVQNHSIALDGVDDYIDFDPIPESSTYSVEFWVKFNTVTYNTRLISAIHTDGDIYSMAILGGNTVYISTGGGGNPVSVTTTVIQPDTWYHMALSRVDATTMDFYLDGVQEIGSITVDAAVEWVDVTTMGSPFILNGNPNGFYLDGIVDEFRVWDTPLTSTDVMNNMNTELTGNETNLVSYYKFDDNNSPNDIEDCSPQCYHAMRKGTMGTLPQFVTDLPNSITDVACGAICCSSMPIASCQDISVQLNNMGSVMIDANDVDNGSTAACGLQSLSIDNNSFDCVNIGTNTILLTVTDLQNNTSSCSAIVTVQDVLPPSAICQDIAVSLDASGTATIAENQADSGSIDECTTSLIFDTDVTSFDCTNIGSNLVILSVTDESNNSATCNSTVTVNDVVVPVANCQNITVSLDGMGNVNITEDQIDNSSSDECTAMLIYDTDITAFDCNSIGSHLVELTVTDESGNTATCSSTVTVEDATAPIAICKDITIFVNPDGTTYTIAGDAVDDGSTDNCLILIMDTDVTDFDISNVGANNVTLSVDDLSGNQSQCSAVVTVECSCDPDTSPLIANSEAGIHTAACKYDDGPYTHYCDNQGRLLLSIDSQTSSNINASDVSISITPGGLYYNQYCSGSGGNEDGSCFISNNDGAVILCRTWDVNSNNTNAFIRFYFDQNDVDIINNEIIANGLNPITDVKQMWFYKVLNNSGHQNPEDLSTTDVQILHNNNSGIASTDNWDLGMTAQSYYAQYEVSTFSGGGGGGADKGSSPICPYIEADIVGTEILSASAMADINVNVSGGLSPYTVTLTDGTMITNYVSGDPITVNVTASTNYEIQSIIDANGCPHSVLSGMATKFINNGNTTPPTAICQNITIDLNAAGFVSIVASDIDNGSSDDLSIQSLNIDQNLFDCSFGGTTMVTLTVTDGDGNSDQCISSVTFNDPNGTCCPYNLNLPNVVNGSKLYNADFVITSNAVITNTNNNTDIKYHAGNNIELNSGFEVKQGSKFEADINPCNWP